MKRNRKMRNGSVGTDMFSFQSFHFTVMSAQTVVCYHNLQNTKIR